MSLKINYKNNIKENRINNFILFVDENFNIIGLKSLLLMKDVDKINKTIKNNQSKDKNFLLLFSLIVFTKFIFKDIIFKYKEL